MRFNYPERLHRFPMSVPFLFGSRKAFLSRREAPQLLPFILSLHTRVHVIYLLIVFIALVIATRRERETRFGANDRAAVTPVYFVCIVLPNKKCDNYNTIIKNMVTITYRNIYYY